MKYLLDTGILIELEHKNRSVLEKLKGIAKDFSLLSITLFNFAEFYYGYLPKKAEDKKEAENFLDVFGQLTLTKASAKRFTELDYKYSKLGLGLKPFDLLTAAIAIEENATLLTTDTDFERVSEVDKVILKP